MNETETHILEALKSDPQKGMEMLVEQFTGLLWSVAAKWLKDPEDIKECINDTFTEFYYKREQFDPQKGSLPNYLAAITRNQAISCYRKNAKHTHVEMPENVSSETDPILQLEQHMDLEQAIASLNPEDGKIIRMKYYDGMTVQEIADSLNLPYETVKKRHQRGIKKMKRSLLITLVLLLAALISACAYLLLRHFGVVPGYGVNVNQEVPVYLLKEPVTKENDTYEIELHDAIYINNSLNITFIIHKKELADGENIVHYANGLTLIDVELNGISLEDDIYISSPVDPHNPVPDTRKDTYIYDNVILPAETKDELSLKLTYDGLDFSAVLMQVKEDNAESYDFDMTEEGGLLAIPHLKNGELIADIYPLNVGDARIEPALVRGHFEEYGEPMLPVIATAEDGTVLKGECLYYRPFGDDTFYQWSFGKAKPGNYMLSIPYVYKSLPYSKDFGITLDLENGPVIGSSYEIPGGTLTISNFEALDKAPEGYNDTFSHPVTIHAVIPPGSNEPLPAPDDPGETQLWLLELTATPLNGQPIVSLGLSHSLEYLTSDNVVPESDFRLLKQSINDNQETTFSYLIRATKEGYSFSKLTLQKNSRYDKVIYRWNHSFTIPITVKDEE